MQPRVKDEPASSGNIAKIPISQVHPIVKKCLDGCREKESHNFDSLRANSVGFIFLPQP